MTKASEKLAQILLEQSGDRVTPARQRVLALLIAEKGIVTHLQIEAELARSEPMDRVTLYRTLDWLVDKSFIHKAVGADRVWRFGVNQQGSAHDQHAHFTCESCAQVTCLQNIPVTDSLPSLPKGFQRKAVELNVRGLCSQCS
jgi:Fur family transcriptional regulator, ferric uptake regulator